MQTKMPAPVEQSKQNQTVHSPTQLFAEPQAIFEDHRQKSAQLKSTQASMAASPHQQNLQALQALQAKMNVGSRVQQLKAQQAPLNQFSQPNALQTIQRMEDEEPLQGKFETDSEPTAQLAEAPTPPAKPNNTGLPDNLKRGIENLSGISMDHVNVHYNSDKPAQLQAHAYAQGSEIHVAPGQEQHLPHEAWHVVQQAQGRVRPTVQMKGGVGVNDDVGLEREADIIGERAVTQRAGIGLQDQAHSACLPPNNHSTSPKILQPKVLSIGSNASLAGKAQGGVVIQRALLDVGQDVLPGPGVQSQADVLAASVRNDTLLWPFKDGDFNGDYSGSVKRAMDWGLQGGEGTAGWYGRQYAAVDFDVIATAAENSSNNLAGIHASLNNEKNKTLIAIRAFRGPNNGSMAGQTEADLGQVHAAVNGQAAALHAAGLINNAGAVVTVIESDPAEAHPNTLPTAKVMFGAAGTVYFKGRGAAVEDALVGSGPSTARALSSIAGANADGAAGVGMHGFVDPGGPSPRQIAGDVGNEIAPVLTPVTGGEVARSYLPGFLGGAHIPPRPEAISAWLSSAKGALLATLTSTTDLHPSNIVAGRSGKKHVIDGEFLLDVTQWQAYQDMLAGGAIANFDIGSFVPPWLNMHMTTLTPGTKALMADAVVNAFIALGADKTHVWANIIAPIRALIRAPELLRVIPLATDTFLGWVTRYNNEPGALARTLLVNQLWLDIDSEMNGIIVMANAAAGRIELGQNLRNGMVPLFHVRANDGVFLLNKAVNIGNTVIGRSVDDLLVQAGAAVSHRYIDMAGIVRARITQ